TSSRPVANDTTAVDAVTATVATLIPTFSVDLARTTFDSLPTRRSSDLTFSEVPTGFALGDVSATGGGLSNLQPVVGNPLQFTATSTADANELTSVLISVYPAQFTDPVGNDNTASNTDTATVDTVNPTMV